MTDVNSLVLGKVRSSLYVDAGGRSDLARILDQLNDSEKEKLATLVSSCLYSSTYAWRANAVIVLGLLGGSARSTVPAIVHSMDCWKCRVTVEAADALQKIGADSAVPALIKALRKAPQPGAGSWSFTIHDAHIVECLKGFGPAARDAAPDLAAYLHFSRCTSEALIAIGSAAVPVVRSIEVESAGKSQMKSVRDNIAAVLSSIEAAPDRLLNAALDSNADVAKTVQRVVSSGANLSISAEAKIAAWLNKLSELDKQAMVDPLVSCLQSESCRERDNAAYLLGQLGMQARSAIPAMIESMRFMDCRGVLQVAQSLRNTGVAYAVPELLNALPQQAPELNATSHHGFSLQHQHVIECLEALGSLAVSATPYFTGWLRSSDGNTVLAQIGPAAIPQIIKEIRRASPHHAMTWVCQNAAEVLSSIGVASSQLLIDALDRAGTQEERVAFSWVFSALRAPALAIDAAPALSRLLLEDAGNASNCTKTALVNLGPAAASAVCECLFPYTTQATQQTSISKYHGAQRILRDMLKSFGAPAIPFLADRMSSVDLKIKSRLAACILIIDPGDLSGLETLVNLLANEDEKARLAALEAAGEARPRVPGPLPPVMKEKLVPALIRCWQDPKPAVRQEAAMVLGKFGITSDELMKYVSIATKQR